MDSLEKARNIRLYHCDCLVGMSRIETGSVDLVLCDPALWDNKLPVGYGDPV